jgi:hypothetical protein
MEKNGTTASATAEEIDTMIAAGDTRTNWDCARATGEEEIARQVAGDPRPRGATRRVEGRHQGAAFSPGRGSARSR